MEAVRVLAVTDAASCAGLRRMLPRTSIEVVGTASTATGARTLTRRLSPEVVLLDLELPQTDVLSLLARLVQEQRKPVVAFVSCMDSTGLLERALAAGASAVVPRPSLRASDPDDVALHALIQRTVALAAGLRAASDRPRCTARTQTNARPPAAALTAAGLHARLIVVGASTGGTQALAELLRDLPANALPVLVVQHMLPEFTHDFAERLNESCCMHVREAETGDRVKRGTVLVAPGGQHMRLGRDVEGSLCVFLSKAAPVVGKHRPSVDVLFSSCAELAGADAIGVLLTGMGDDGARGLLAMRSAGAFTIAQDQTTSVCFGMPSAAIKRGAATQVLPLHRIARLLSELQS